MTRSKKAPGDYAVGYGKPPLHTRFRKGVSGNPGGRPAKAPLERIKTLALREAYRAVPVKDGGDTVTLPAIRAVLRRQLALAAKGNGSNRGASKTAQSSDCDLRAVTIGGASHRAARSASE